MPDRIGCPNCGKSLKFGNASAGQRVKCPKCGVLFLIPGQKSSTGVAASPQPAAAVHVQQTTTTQLKAKSLGSWRTTSIGFVTVTTICIATAASAWYFGWMARFFTKESAASAKQAPAKQQGVQSKPQPLISSGAFGKQIGRGNPVIDDNGRHIGFTTGIYPETRYAIDGLAGVSEMRLVVDPLDNNSHLDEILSSAEITQPSIVEVVQQHFKTTNLYVHEGKTLVDDGIDDVIRVDCFFCPVSGENDQNPQLIMFRVNLSVYQPVTLRRSPRNTVMARTYSTRILSGLYPPDELKKAFIDGLHERIDELVSAYTEANASAHVARTRTLGKLSDATIDGKVPVALTVQNLSAESIVLYFCDNMGVSQATVEKYCRDALKTAGLRVVGANENLKGQPIKVASLIELGPNPVLKPGIFDGICFSLNCSISELAELPREAGAFALVDIYSRGGLGSTPESSRMSQIESAIDTEIAELKKTLEFPGHQ